MVFFAASMDLQQLNHKSKTQLMTSSQLEIFKNFQGDSLNVAFLHSH